MTAAESLLRPATSADVARRAGVSRSTVSNILNGNDARFSPETRQKVQDAAKELDYQPSLAGRSLVSGRSETIVVLVANVAFAAHLQNAVDRVMTTTRHLGGNVVIRLAGDTPQATAEALAILRPLAVVDLGVLSMDERDWLERRGTIIVPNVTPDPVAPLDGGISQLQAAALLDHDPRVLWFAGPADTVRDPFAPSRFAALAVASQVAGLPEPKSVSVEVTLQGGLAGLAEVLAGPLPAGIACYNDDVALALLAAARERDVDVPNTIAIVGVDNSPVGQMWRPRLTTVDTDLEGMVDAIAIALRSRLGEPGLDVPAPHGQFSLIRGDTA